MASKGVMDRHRIAKTIVAAARTHAREVGERLQEILAPAVGEGETLPDFVTFQLQLARYLEQRIDAIVQADELHFKELDDDQEPRRRRDEATQAVYDTLVAIRDSLTAAFGADRGAELLGVEGRTSLDPLTLFRQASRALERLTDESLELPPARLAGVDLDLATLAGQLQPALDELGQSLTTVDRELRETETTILEKDKALDAFDTAVSSIGRMLTACDDLAGFPAYSDKIRLSLPGRRRSGTSAEEEPTLPDGGGGETLPEGDGTPPPSEPLPGPPTAPPEGSEI
jgi:hypothetical protein